MAISPTKTEESENEKMTERPMPPVGTAISNATTKEMINAKLAQLQAKGTRKGGTNQLPGKDERYVRNIVPGTTTRVRILPGSYHQDAGGNWYQKPWFVETGIHRLKGPNMDGYNVHCPKIARREPCPICRYIQNLWNSGSEMNIALAKEIKPRSKYYVNVVQRNRQYADQNGQQMMEATSQNPLILSCGSKLFQRILFLCTRVGDLTELINGHDFDIICTQQGEWYNYDMSDIVHESSDAGSSDWINYWMGNLNDLDSLVKPASHDAIMAQLSEFLDDKLRAGGSQVEAFPMPEPRAGGMAIPGTSFGVQQPMGIQSQNVPPAQASPPPQASALQQPAPPPISHPSFSAPPGNPGAYTPSIPPIQVAESTQQDELPWETDEAVGKGPVPQQQTIQSPPQQQQQPTPPSQAQHPAETPPNSFLDTVQRVQQAGAAIQSGPSAPPPPSASSQQPAPGSFLERLKQAREGQKTTE